MMDTEHTPLPWTRHPHNNRICHVTDHGSFDVVSEDPRIGDADAAIIVHSVNLLPELVSVLSEARDKFYETSDWPGNMREFLATIDALLAKATSKATS